MPRFVFDEVLQENGELLIVLEHARGAPRVVGDLRSFRLHTRSNSAKIYRDIHRIVRSDKYADGLALPMGR
jgi:hypothetical protein